MRGMRTSSSTRSGGSFWTISSAVIPSAARRTSQSMVERYRRINSRFAAPSSTTRTTGISSNAPLSHEVDAPPASIVNPALPPTASKNAWRPLANQTRSGDCDVRSGGRRRGGRGAERRQGQLQLLVGPGEVAAPLQDLCVRGAVTRRLLAAAIVIRSGQGGGKLE